MLCLLLNTQYKMAKTGNRQHKPSLTGAMITIMKLNNFILIGLTFTLLSSHSLAEDVRYYDFEIIIFESLDEAGKISEAWKQDALIETPEAVVTLGKPYPGPMPKEYKPKYTFKYLLKKTYRLTQEAKLLEENENYRILMHTAWRQPGMPEETALPIRLHKEFIVTKQPQQAPVTTDPDMPAVNLPTPRDSLPSAPLQTRTVLDGYLKIVLSRYLHANFDLVYSTGLPLVPTTNTIRTLADEEDDTKAINEPVIVNYRLQQTRKMRSKEVHYIDHPVIGVVILAWPVLLEN